MYGRNAWRSRMLMLACAPWLLAACSGEGGEGPASDGGRFADTVTVQSVPASQARDYASCEELGRDADAFLQDRHALTRPGRPEWPSNSISCIWSFSDDGRCRAIDFAPGDSGDCVSDMVYITVGRGVGAMDSVEVALEHFTREIPGRVPWIRIDDPRLRRPEYANIAVFRSAGNDGAGWEFRMAVTGSSNLEPLPTEVVVRHILRHPGGEQPHEQLKAISPPPPPDAAVVSGYLQMLEPFEADRAWPR